jgi:hypothetical protein
MLPLVATALEAAAEASDAALALTVTAFPAALVVLDPTMPAVVRVALFIGAATEDDSAAALATALPLPPAITVTADPGADATVARVEGAALIEAIEPMDSWKG